MGIKIRLSILTIGFFLANLLIIGRLFYWQVLSYERFSSVANQQHLVSLSIPAGRGKILSSDYFPLVDNRTTYLVYAFLPNLKKPPAEVSRLLSPFLATEAADLRAEKAIQEKLETKSLSWIPLKHGIELEKRNEIEELNLEGIGFEEEEKRDYPESTSAAQLLGFVGSEASGKSKGYFGLEGFYDRQLKGRGGIFSQERDALGRPILISGFGEQKPENGRDLVLYLDRTAQFIAYQKLKWGMEKYGAKSGSVTVMDPKTGGILAMVSLPSYDPGNFSRYESQLYRNPVIADLFEPGSIMKPIIMSVALNEGIVSPETRCDRCSGPRVVGDYTIQTFNDQYHPNLTMVEVLENSDNTGIVFVSDKLGSDLIHDYLVKYGFNEKTGIDLEEETTGNLRSKGKWLPIDLATASFGQGVSITQLQILRAYCAIANSGKLPQPLVVQKIITAKKEIPLEPKTVRQVIKPEVAEAMTEMLVSVTQKSPLHFPFDRIPELAEYQIAAKSGTAQIPVAGHYDPTKTIGSVIGFAPANNPKFVILVNLVEPSARPWGSDTAGPIFFEIVKELLFYYGIQPG